MLVNLTPHKIVVIREDGDKVEIPPSGYTVRVSATVEEAGEVDGIPVYREALGRPVLVDPKGNETFVDGTRLAVFLIDPFPQATGLIVSRVAAEALRKTGYHPLAKPPLYVPGQLVRDEQGRVVGCKGLIQVE